MHLKFYIGLINGYHTDTIALRLSLLSEKLYGVVREPTGFNKKFENN